MQCLIIPVEKAQEMVAVLSQANIPYTVSRPVMKIIEEGKIANLTEVAAEQAQSNEGGSNGS
jgi:hypothetical protein